MQEPTQEHNGQSGRAALALLGGVAVLLAVHWPRLGTGARAAEALLGWSGPPLVRHAMALAAAAATVLVALLLLPRRRRAADGFAALLAGGLAAVLPLAAELLLPGARLVALPGGVAGGIALAGALAATVALTAAPLLRERGVLSLCLLPLLVAAPAAALRWRIEGVRAHAAPLQLLQERVPLESPFGLLLPAEPPLPVATLVAGLRRPAMPLDLDVWPVAEDSAAAAWLQRTGVPLVTLTGLLRQPDAAAARLLPGALRPEVVVERDAAGRPSGLWVRAGPLAAGGAVVAFGPWPATHVPLDAQGNARLDGIVGTGMDGGWPQDGAPVRIRVLAVSRGPEPAYGSTDLTLP